jgi:SAM-dependent methyltransferase
MSRSEIAYEATQNFNFVTRFLHSFRHDLASEFVGELASAYPDRTVRVLDIGCATGKTFSLINQRHRVDYVGIDAKPLFISAAQVRYHSAENAKFLLADATDPGVYAGQSADIVFALETLEHIPERDVVRIVENVCHIVRPKLFVASVPIEIGPALWIKNVGSKLMGYTRVGYDWRSTFWAGLYRLDKLPRHTTGHIGFNWYWLEQTIRHNAKIRESRSLPYRWLPKMFAPTVMFIAEPSSQ